MKCPHCGHTHRSSASAAACALQAARKTRAGGRPRSAAPRCQCGAMTAARAAARGHRCTR